MRVCVIGLDGSGKTSLLQLFPGVVQQTLKTLGIDCPVETFSMPPRKPSFAASVLRYATRLQRAFQAPSAGVLFEDRQQALDTAVIGAIRCPTLKNFSVFRRFLAAQILSFDCQFPEAYIYLKATPEVASNRIETRGAGPRAPHESLENLRDADQQYTAFFQALHEKYQLPVFVLNADKPLLEVLKEANQKILPHLLTKLQQTASAQETQPVTEQCLPDFDELKKATLQQTSTSTKPAQKHRRRL